MNSVNNSFYMIPKIPQVELKLKLAPSKKKLKMARLKDKKKNMINIDRNGGYINLISFAI